MKLKILKRKRKKMKKFKYILIICLVVMPFFGLTKAFFTSEATLGESVITTGTWEVTPNIIITEVMWTGTSLSEDDQWIELYNNTDEDINIGKWKIEYLRDIGKPPIMIPANKIISANSYFLISNYPKQSNNTILNVDIDVSNASIYLLPTDNGDLVLRDTEGNEVDRVPGEWPVGGYNDDMDTYHSMQRDMEDLNSWYSCDNPDVCTDSKYWKEGNLNYGTPGDGGL